MSGLLWRNLVKCTHASYFNFGRLVPVSGSSYSVRFSSTGGGGDPQKVPRPESLGSRTKKEDSTKGKGPVSWVNLGVTGVVVLSMVRLFAPKLFQIKYALDNGLSFKFCTFMDDLDNLTLNE